MPKTLVVVESPAKAKTIQKYLGKGYEVLASKGHVKDLPKKMGIDVEHGFRETYEIIEAKSKVLLDLKHEVKDADTLALERDLSQRMGLKVDVVDRGGAGEIRISYSTLEQLDDLCRRLLRAQS